VQQEPLIWEMRRSSLASEVREISRGFGQISSLIHLEFIADSSLAAIFSVRGNPLGIVRIATTMKGARNYFAHIPSIAVYVSIRYTLGEGDKVWAKD
jgi:hypothetical protein